MYKLPEELRPKLKEPLGPVRSTEEAYDTLRQALFVITIGDVTTLEMIERGVEPRVAVVDFKTKREKDDSLRRELVKYGERSVEADNPAAEITSDLWDALAEAIGEDESTLIKVEGEEDLAALPAILLAPEGAIVAYGQPDEGIVTVEVDDESREMVKTILAEMEVV